VSGDRYHIPSDPFIAMLAAYAISEIALRLGTPKENDFAN
jgi:hypothetical protein